MRFFVWNVTSSAENLVHTFLHLQPTVRTLQHPHSPSLPDWFLSLIFYCCIFPSIKYVYQLWETAALKRLLGCSAEAYGYWPVVSYLVSLGDVCQHLFGTWPYSQVKAILPHLLSFALTFPLWCFILLSDKTVCGNIGLLTKMPPAISIPEEMMKQWFKTPPPANKPTVFQAEERKGLLPTPANWDDEQGGRGKTKNPTLCLLAYATGYQLELAAGPYLKGHSYKHIRTSCWIVLNLHLEPFTKPPDMRCCRVKSCLIPEP